MKKRYWNLIFLVVIAVLLSACGKEDLGNSYVEGKDYQYMLKAMDSFGQLQAKGTNGLFFIQENYIYYLPESADILIPLCNKVECMHTKENNEKKYAECNAYVGDSMGSNLGISFYDGYLYFLKTELEEDGVQRLYRIKEDGSGKEIVYEWDGWIVENWILHRGEVFYAEHTFYVDEKTQETAENFCVKKISVDGTGVQTPELVYESQEGVSIQILTQLNAYGNYVYFYAAGGTGTAEQLLDEEAWLDYFYSEQVAINILTGEKSVVAVPNADSAVSVSSVTFWQDKLIYQGFDHADQQGLQDKVDIYIAELDGSDSKVLLEDVPQGFRMMADDNYLYLTNTALVIRGEAEQQIYQVYDTDMQLVDTMEITYLMPYDGAIGDANGFYFFKGVGEDDIDLVYFDKSTIGTYQGAPFSYTKVADWEYANADLEE